MIVQRDHHTEHRLAAIRAWHEHADRLEREKRYAASKEDDVDAVGWIAIAAIALFAVGLVYLAITGGKS